MPFKNNDTVVDTVTGIQYRVRLTSDGAVGDRISHVDRGYPSSVWVKEPQFKLVKPYDVVFETRSLG